MGNARSENWKVQDLTTQYHGYVRSDDPHALVIPAFQRDFVWGKEKRIGLVDSLKKGYPVGAIIVRKTNKKVDVPNQDGKSFEVPAFELIDGLQRSTTLILHGLDPLQVITRDQILQVLTQSDIAPEEVEDVVRRELNADIDRGAFVTAVLKWLPACSSKKTFERIVDGVKERRSVPEIDKTLYKGIAMRESLAEAFGVSSPELARIFASHQYDQKFDSFLTRLLRSVNVDEMTIPVIIWDGEQEDSPEVFLRVNQGGLKLSKYESLAASYSYDFTDIRSGEIYDLANKALGANPGDEVIERWADSTKLDLFGALVGLSHKLSIDYPHFFGSVDDGVDDEDSDEDSDVRDKKVGERRVRSIAAFNIVALVAKTGLTLKQMQNLPKNLADSIGREDSGDLRFKRIVDAVTQACSLLEKALIEITYSTRDNPKKSSVEIAHSEHAFAALVARVAVELLEDPASISRLREKSKVFKAHYLRDVLAGIVISGNASDAAAFDRVWTSMGDTGLAANSYYLESLDRKNLESVLDRWFEDDLISRRISKESKKRPRIYDDQRAVLKFVTAPNAPWQLVATEDKAFHIDHSIPFKKVIDWARSRDESYPVGCVANLALLPGKLNLHKGKLTLDEFFKKDKSKDQWDKSQVYRMVPYSEGQLSFEEDQALTRKEFEKLMKEIWVMMKEILFSQFGV